jgi:hypothetical protein
MNVLVMGWELIEERREMEFRFHSFDIIGTHSWCMRNGAKLISQPLLLLSFLEIWSDTVPHEKRIYNCRVFKNNSTFGKDFINLAWYFAGLHEDGIEITCVNNKGLYRFSLRNPF